MSNCSHCKTYLIPDTEYRRKTYKDATKQANFIRKFFFINAINYEKKSSAYFVQKKLIERKIKMKVSSQSYF